MKIPSAFVPPEDDKNLVKLLDEPEDKSKKKYGITELILDPSLMSIFPGDEEKCVYTTWVKNFKKAYPDIKKKDLANMIRVNYNRDIADILEFKDEKTLNNYMSNIKKYANKKRKKVQYVSAEELANKLKCHGVLIKDVYAVFIYSHLLKSWGHKHSCNSIIEGYKKEFGFEEIKGR
ncbi:hypothetical protein FJZ53_02210 [Candidatus Woesearchaeota archaeon]|nr:hypothetical protein [Candidatus Woesearchaeota archaeon]